MALTTDLSTVISGIPIHLQPGSMTAGWEVQRSPDGSTWTTIVKLPPIGAGGSTWIDFLPLGTGPYYYQFRQIKDGWQPSAFVAMDPPSASPVQLDRASVYGAVNVPPNIIGVLVDKLSPNTRFVERFDSASYADPDTIDGVQTYIDFPQSTNFLRIGQTPKAVTGATNATPIVVTVTAHGYQSGDTVTIRGVGGNTAANGTWTITVVDANTFQLQGSTGNGAYTSGGHCVRLALTISAAGLLTIYADGPATFRNQIVFGPIAGPATPPTGFVEMYSKSGQSPSALFWKNDAGTEFVVGMRIVQRDVFSTNGTWTKNPTAVMVMVHAWGGGGGGGGGGSGTLQANAGGGGGAGGGCYSFAIYRAQDLAATVAVTAGGGGSGGAAGATGNSGSLSSFGVLLFAFGGGGGQGGGSPNAAGAGGTGGGQLASASTASGGAVGGGASSGVSNPGGATIYGGGGGGGSTYGNNNPGGAGGISFYGGGGGGGGGDQNTSVGSLGGAGGRSGADSSGDQSGQGGAGGGSLGAAGTAGGNATTEYQSGQGGGGGAGNTSNTSSVTGGKGGDGGTPGGGGGGGGGANTSGGSGAGTGGAGGNGGGGQVIVYQLG